MRPFQTPNPIFLLALILLPLLSGIVYAQVPLEDCFSPAVAVNPVEPDPGDTVKIDIWFCRAPPNSYAVYYNETRVLAAGTVNDWNVTVYVTTPPQPGWLTIYVNDAVVKKVPVGATPPDAIEKPIVVEKPVLPDDPVMVAILGGLGVALIGVIAISLSGRGSRRGVGILLGMLLLATGSIAALVIVDKLTGGTVTDGMAQFWHDTGAGLKTLLVLAGSGLFILLVLAGLAQLKR